MIKVITKITDDCVRKYEHSFRSIKRARVYAKTLKESINDPNVKVDITLFCSTKKPKLA